MEGMQAIEVRHVRIFKGDVDARRTREPERRSRQVLDASAMSQMELERLPGERLHRTGYAGPVQGIEPAGILTGGLTSDPVPLEQRDGASIVRQEVRREGAGDSTANDDDLLP